MSLTSSRLSVSENCSIVAFEDVRDNRTSSLHIDILLKGVVAVRAIEGPHLGLFSLHLGVSDMDFSTLVALNNLVILVGLFFRR
jgi:hypothetical protein